MPARHPTLRARHAVMALLAASPGATLAQGAPVPELGASLVQMALGLAAVIAVLLASLWAIRRLGAPRGSAAAMKVLGAAAVGPRERVVLVELGEQVLVLGVAPGSVTKLHELKRSELPQGHDASGQATPPGRSFASWLKQASEHRNAS
ncbi:flagellar biosynthetic protein FliO [Thauera sp. 27]|nr:flagellar biosynthetic protein FliO [Thauera sp. 27]